MHVLAINSAHVLDVGLLLPKMLPDILVTVTRRIDRRMLPGFIVFDSGGFMIALENRYSEADEYLKKLVRIYRSVAAPNDLLLQLDLPLLPTMDKELRLSLQEKNIRYYRVMRKIFGSRLVPVVHGWKEDEWSLQVQHLEKARVIGVGSFFGMVSPPIKKVEIPRLDPKFVVKRLIAVTRYLLNHTNAKLMLLGAGSPKALFVAAALGYENADSSSWRVAAFFGELYHPTTLDRVKAKDLDRYLEVFREAYREIEACYGAPWSFEEWSTYAREKSRTGYIARAWLNAMVTKLVQHMLEDMPEKRVIEQMLRLYERSARWRAIAKIVAKHAHYLGFRKAIARADRVKHYRV